MPSQPLRPEDLDRRALDVELVPDLHVSARRETKVAAEVPENPREAFGHARTLASVAEDIDVGGRAGLGSVLVCVELDHQPADEAPVALRTELDSELAQLLPQPSGLFRWGIDRDRLAL